jgi:hypothetical protein
MNYRGYVIADKSTKKLKRFYVYYWTDIVGPYHETEASARAWIDAHQPPGRYK